MTPTVRSLVAALLFALCFTPAAIGAPKKASKPAKAAPAKSARQDKKQTARQEKHARADKRSAKDARAERRERASDKSRDRRDRSASKSEQRETARERRERLREEKRAAKDDARGGKSSGKLSRRERLAEARREAERRRREEAARRAEAARQAAIARAIALARQRAADQALRDETVTNILKDDTTGEDLEVRRVAVEALGNNAGSVVVMDPKNGRIFTVVNQDWAMRRGFKPCSTVKLVTGLAGLAENVISPSQTVNVSGGSFRLDLTDSLAFSNNTYFQIVSGQVGFDRMMNYAHEFGLGQPTGVNHANESGGRLPVIKSGYSLNRMGSHGDDIEVTTLQLANMASTIANGGTVLIPHLPRTPEENVRFKKEERRRVNVPKEQLQRLIPGMVGTVNYGTGKNAYDPTQTVAGKTGTCISQDRERTWLGLFTSFAPVHDPHLAVAVITRGSGQRGRLAAGVAGRIYRGLNHRFGNQGGAPMLANDRFIPRPKIDPRAAAAVSDEDKEADAYVISEATGGDVNATNQAGAPTSGFRTTMNPAQQTRPTESTLRPAVKSSTQMPSNGSERPRRVLETQP